MVKESLNQPTPEDWEVLNALQEFRKPQQISTRLAVFNTVLISAPELRGTILLSRAVHIKSVRPGEPDKSVFPVCVIDQKGNRQRLRDLNLPINGIVNWEDPRIGPNRTLGFTVVIHEGDKYIPHPALVNVEVKDGNLKVVGEPRIFENLTGKDVIPTDEGFIYRPEGVSHQLHCLDLQKKLLKIIDFSDFKNIWWLSKKLGTTTRPIELENGLELLFIHGVRANEMGIDGRIKDDIYALGIAVLDESWQVLAVDERPFLERGNFLPNLPPQYDLNPKKEVVYLCSFLENGNKDGYVLPVNVGDRITVFTPISSLGLRARVSNLLRKTG